MGALRQPEPLEAGAQGAPARLAALGALLFALTAGVGTWAAPDRALAAGKLAVLLGALLLGLGVLLAARRGERGWMGAAWAAALLAGAVGGYFLLTFDGADSPTRKVLVLDSAARWWQAQRPALLVPDDLHPNVAGGALALLLPLGASGVAWRWPRHRPAALLGAAALAVGGLALLFTLSRGAWAGLAVGALLAALLEWRTVHPRWRRGWDGLALLALVGGLALLFYALAVRGDGSAQSRLALWRDVLPLVQDYALTGHGLASGTMVFSSYALLIHVPFLPHAHNLALQLALEQGLPGLAGFGLLLGSALLALRRSYGRGGGSSGRLARAATTTALVALLVHGSVDAGLYYSRLALVQLVPLAFALALPQPPRPARRLGGALGLLALLALALVGSLPPGRALWQANLGAVAQTRAELSQYRWPTWPMQDALRRDPSLPLEPAIAHYRAALALDPGNATALRRLGQIELSRGDYGAACTHLRAAYRAAAWASATRQLLGECAALEGDAAAAAALWRTVNTAQGQLALRLGWYELLGEQPALARFQAALARFQPPP